LRFDVGARWSNDLKDYAGTPSCELPHAALVLSGCLHVVMDDGSEDEFGPNQVMLLPIAFDACWPPLTVTMMASFRMPTRIGQVGLRWSSRWRPCRGGAAGRLVDVRSVVVTVAPERGRARTRQV
jgi:hypothetical protein